MSAPLCLPLEAWPEVDRRLWLEATAARPARRFTETRPADRLAAKSIRKTFGGYSRWLGYLAAQGMLEADVPPADRVTPDRVAGWLDALRAEKNRDYTVVGRLEELQRALHLIAPGKNFKWLTLPGGVSVRSRLPMSKRVLTVYHPRILFEWGLEMVETAKSLAGSARRRVMLRDGVMIALLAARAPRLRSLSALRLGVNLRREPACWRIELDEHDVKTSKPIAYPLPAQLTAAMDRYVEVERAELLGGRIDDAFWIDWTGSAMLPRGIEKRIRWWSAKKFGKAQAFGPHRFRYCIATYGPIEDPEAPTVSAAILGITAEVHRKSYDRGARAAAAARFHSTLRAARAETATLARNAFARARRAGAAPQEEEDTSA
jgi:site-specific recombinase XerD